MRIEVSVPRISKERVRHTGGRGANFCTLSKEKVRTGVLNRLSRSAAVAAGELSASEHRSSVIWLIA
jgi:hypothetical protein